MNQTIRQRKGLIMIDQKNRNQRKKLNMATIKKPSIFDRIFEIRLVAVESIKPIHKRGAW